MAGSFSFDTPEEVMHVLASVRASGIDAAQKSNLRDLVLSYTNGGKDPSLKIQIEQQLTQLGIIPNSKQTTLSVQEQHDFGSSRSVPSFTPSARPVQARPAAPSQQPAVQATVPVQESVQSAASIQSVQGQAAPQQIPAAPAESVTVQPNPAPQPPAASNVSQPEQKQNATSAPVANPTPTPTPAPVRAAGMDPLQRIREIKALVNEKVGNPVNLVDIDNTIGREYMTSLLEAMKKLSAGGSVESEMARLETAYNAVESLLEKKDTELSAQLQSEALAPQTVPATSSNQAAKPETTHTVPVRSSSVPQVSGVPSSDDSASRWANTDIRFTAPVAPVKEPIASNETPLQQPAPVANLKSVAESDNAPDDKIQKSSPSILGRIMPQRQQVQASEVSTQQQPVVAEPPKPVITATVPTPTIDLDPKEEKKSETPTAAVTPLSKSGAPLKSVTDLPAKDSLETAKGGDPLHTREVDDGLDQLLADWVLFKKSGLLGTGPKGMQHPLFQKIKDLEIPILLAGRFDGATQEIKQSITDYMNGWRYEQGIIYEKGETFEHYLRRVIRHILDLQK